MRFWIDFLSSIPFDGLHIKGLEFLNIIGMLKLVRVTRLSKIIQHLDVKKKFKTKLKVIQLLFYLVLYIHLQACIWFILVKVEKNWVPTMDYIFAGTELYDEEIFWQYCNSVYHSVMLFGVNEMASRTSLVLSLSSFIMLFSAMINANIFGIMANLIFDISVKDVKFQEKYDTANTAMANLDFNSATCSKVRAYLITTQATQDQQEELDSFLQNISPSLRFKVLVTIFSVSMKRNRVFTSLFNDYGEESVGQLPLSRINLNNRA
jgi:hypothetical protein